MPDRVFKFIARGWHQSSDPASGDTLLRPEFDSDAGCEIACCISAQAGSSDLEFHCMNAGCDPECILVETDEGNGSKFYRCVCQ